MKKNLTLLLLLLLISLEAVHAQYFSRLYTRPYPFYATFTDITVLKDNNFIALLDIKHPLYDSTILNVLKINIKGDTIWAKSYGLDKKKYRYTALKAIEVENGNLLITGYCTMPEPPSKRRESFLLKIDKNGSEKWLRYFSDKSNLCSTSSILLTDDGNYIITGYSQNYNDIAKDYSFSQAYIVKIDTVGNKIWENTFGEAFFHENIFGVEQTSNQSIIIIASKSQNSDFDNLMGQINYQTGKLEWYKNYGNPNENQSFAQITKTIDGNFLLSGSESPHNNTKLENRKGTITKIKENGDIIWHKTYQSSCDNTFFYDIKELNSQDIMVIGTQDEKPYKVGVSSFTSEGNLKWHRSFDYNKGAVYSERFNSFCLTPDNGFIVAGSAFPIGVNSSQGWLLKLDSLGCDYAGCAKSTSTAEVENGNEVFVIAPNPADLSVTITLGNEVEEVTNIKVELFDLQGRLIQKNLLSENNNRSIQLNISELSNGIYFVKIKNTTQKLIVQR